MAVRCKKQEEKTNYNFLLKSMIAMTAAAIATAAIITAVILNAAPITAPTLFASSFIFTPIIPIAILAIVITCLLPFLIPCNNSYTTVSVPDRYNYGNFGFFSPSPYVNTHYHGSNNTGAIHHVHGHPGGPIHTHNSGNVHGHTSSVYDRPGGNMHGHTPGEVYGPPSGNIHGHTANGFGGGFVHKHH